MDYISSYFDDLSFPILFIIGFVVIAVIFIILLRKIKSSPEILSLIAGFVMLTIGLCHLFHFSLILTNMIIGLIVVNTQKQSFVDRIGSQLSLIMPFFFIFCSCRSESSYLGVRSSWNSRYNLGVAG